MENGGGASIPSSSADALDEALDLELTGDAPPPKPSKFQPKSKGKNPKSEPISSSFVPSTISDRVKKQEDSDGADVKSAAGLEDKLRLEPSGVIDEAAGAPMVVDDDGENTVVREIDVFFRNSLDEDTQLYLMQYPLRPYWRPYELYDDGSTEVRVKPEESKVEVDMSLDVDSTNYDSDAPECLRIQKQTYSSSNVPFATPYAVGILNGNKLHLNRLHAVVQLRPVHRHLDAGGVQKRKITAQNAEVNTKSNAKSVVVPKSSKQKGKLVVADSCESIDAVERWVLLKYHATDSDVSAVYQQKMAEELHNNIPSTTKMSEYVNTLCPGTSTDNKRDKGLLRRTLLLLPLEERLKRWLRQGSEINRFDALMHLAPDDLPDNVLKVLRQHAYLVQGLWVSKSSLLYEGNVALVRDHILCLFSKNRVIQYDKLDRIKMSKSERPRILSSLAVERPKLKDWKFKEDSDFSFMKRYPNIVEEQQLAWSSKERQFKDHFLVTNKPRNPVKQGNMPPEIRPQLIRLLQHILHEKKVCSLNTIVNSLRELAKSLSVRSKDDGRSTLPSVAAWGASAKPDELRAVISQIAEDIHGLYVLKSFPILKTSATSATFTTSALNPLRHVVIQLFKEKPPNARLKKGEIKTAAQRDLKRDISDSEYNQVVNDLCTSDKGCWALKSDLSKH